MQVELDVIRKFDIDKKTKLENNDDKVLVAFKIFSEKTPNKLTLELFHRNNILPLRNIDTRVLLSYDNDGEGRILCNHTIIYYRVTGVLLPKIEIENILYVLREGYDEDFNNLEYFNKYFDNEKQVRTLNFNESKNVLAILAKFKKENLFNNKLV